MALTDPQSITISGTPHSLPRTNTGDGKSTYANADDTVSLTVSHVRGRRNRRMARVDHRKIAADPLTAENVEFSMSTYMVVDVPRTGYTVVEAKAIVDGFITALNASSGALITKILGGES